MLNKFLKSLSPALYAKLSLIYHCYIRKYAQISYAQEGEDLILLDLFINDKTLVGGGAVYRYRCASPF